MLVTEDFIYGVSYWLVNGDEDQAGFCSTEEDPEQCSDFIDSFMEPSLKALYLAAISDDTRGPALCNDAIPSTCPVYLF